MSKLIEQWRSKTPSQITIETNPTELASVFKEIIFEEIGDCAPLFISVDDETYSLRVHFEDEPDGWDDARIEYFGDKVCTHFAHIAEEYELAVTLLQRLIGNTRINAYGATIDDLEVIYIEFPYDFYIGELERRDEIIVDRYMTSFAQHLQQEIITEPSEYPIASKEFFKYATINPMDFCRIVGDWILESMNVAKTPFVHITVNSHEQSYEEMDSQFVISSYNEGETNIVAVIPFDKIIEKERGIYEGLSESGLRNFFQIVVEHFGQ